MMTGESNVHHNVGQDETALRRAALESAATLGAKIAQQALAYPPKVRVSKRRKAGRALRRRRYFDIMDRAGEAPMTALSGAALCFGGLAMMGAFLWRR